MVQALLAGARSRGAGCSARGTVYLWVIVQAQAASLGCNHPALHYLLTGSTAPPTCASRCAGMAPRYPLYQRIALMQLVRQLLADPLVTYHLFASYDLSVERKLDAVQASHASHACMRLCCGWEGVQHSAGGGARCQLEHGCGLRFDSC